MFLTRAELDARVSAFVLAHEAFESPWREAEVWMHLIGEQLVAIQTARHRGGPLHSMVPTHCRKDIWIIERCYVPMLGDERARGTLLFEKGTERFAKRRRFYDSHSAARELWAECGCDPDRVCCALGRLEDAAWWADLHASVSAATYAGISNSTLAAVHHRAGSV